MRRFLRLIPIIIITTLLWQNAVGAEFDLLRPMAAGERTASISPTRADQEWGREGRALTADERNRYLRLSTAMVCGRHEAYTTEGSNTIIGINIDKSMAESEPVPLKQAIGMEDPDVNGKQIAIVNVRHFVMVRDDHPALAIVASKQFFKCTAYAVLGQDKEGHRWFGLGHLLPHVSDKKGKAGYTYEQILYLTRYLSARGFKHICIQLDINTAELAGLPPLDEITQDRLMSAIPGTQITLLPHITRGGGGASVFVDNQGIVCIHNGARNPYYRYRWGDSLLRDTLISETQQATAALLGCVLRPLALDEGESSTAQIDEVARIEEPLIDKMWGEIDPFNRMPVEKSIRQLQSVFEESEKHPADFQVMMAGNHIELGIFMQGELEKHKDIFDERDIAACRGALRHAMDNLYEHGRYFGVLLLRFQVVDQKRGRFQFILLDRGRSFLDERGQHVPIQEVVKRGISFSPRRHEKTKGHGLFYMDELGDNLSITGIDQSSGYPRAYHWETGWTTEKELDTVPAGVSSGTQIIFTKEIKLSIDAGSVSPRAISPQSAAAALGCVLRVRAASERIEGGEGQSVSLPETAIRQINMLVSEKQAQLHLQNIRRPVMMVIDGDSCAGKSCLANGLGGGYRVYIIEKDKIVRDTMKIIEQDPGLRDADPYVFWANIIAKELGRILERGDIDLVIFEGIYALDVVKKLEDGHGIVFDIKINLVADKATRKRILQAKRLQGLLDPSITDDDKFLEENMQGHYGFSPNYDLVIDNSDRMRTKTTQIASPRRTTAAALGCV